MTTPHTIPGFRRDHLGRYVPEDQFKPLDLLRDEMVRKLVEQAEKASAELARVKREMFDEIAAFVELSAMEYGVSIGGGKGNITLMTIDGEYRITRAIAEHICFDERLQVAKKLIDECLNDWTSESCGALKIIVQDAFRVDKSENLRVQQILGLRGHNIEDERWKRAMEAISDSIQVVGSKNYVRVHKRVDGTGEYAQIPLDMSKVLL